MKQETTLKNCSQHHINRYVYGLYMILVIYLFIKGDYEWAFTNMGIALIFDPFDNSVKWSNRPFYQKMWLFIHLAITIGGLGFIMFNK
jgi:formate/nitrite transporter FocA (FNT family)